MPDPLSPTQRTVMLRRIDPELGMARICSLMVEREPKFPILLGQY